MFSMIHDAENYAVCSNGDKILLRNLRPNEVKFSGGLWRVIDEFPHKTITISDKEFVQLNKLPNSGEYIQYYDGAQVGENCYGKFMQVRTHVLARCGSFWGYGANADLARGMVLSNAIKEPGLQILKLIHDFYR
ncbi:MAG: hypothetical protein LBO08_00750 [Rickettsiales bacterium]|jgi:hypothetical protein|nr:hypothetical protein [Rickettsiales bacterium]